MADETSRRYLFVAPSTSLTTSSGQASTAPLSLRVQRDLAEQDRFARVFLKAWHKTQPDLSSA
jgi:hypothetical protein